MNMIEPRLRAPNYNKFEFLHFPVFPHFFCPLLTTFFLQLNPGETEQNCLCFESQQINRIGRNFAKL